MIDEISTYTVSEDGSDSKVANCAYVFTGCKATIPPNNSEHNKYPLYFVIQYHSS